MEVVMRSGVAQKVTGKRLCCLSEFSWITLNFRGIESQGGLAISSVTWASHVQMVQLGHHAERLQIHYTTNICINTAVSREAWAMLPLPATLAQSHNLAHASLETAVSNPETPDRTT